VAISVGGDVRLVGVTSQAARPSVRRGPSPRWSRTSSTRSATARPTRCWRKRSTNSRPSSRRGRAATCSSAGRQRVPGGLPPRGLSDSQSAGRRPALRQHCGGGAAAPGPDDPVPAPLEGGGHRGHGGVARPRPQATGRHADLRRLPVQLQRAGTESIRPPASRRATGPATAWADGLAGFSATARSGRWARKAFCTATRRRSRCSSRSSTLLEDVIVIGKEAGRF